MQDPGNRGTASFPPALARFRRRRAKLQSTTLRLPKLDIEQFSEPSSPASDTDMEVEFNRGQPPEGNVNGDATMGEASQDPPPASSSNPSPPMRDSYGRFVEVYPGAARCFGTGRTFFDKFNSDEHAEARSVAPYYPFASREEWSLARFLLTSGMSMEKVNEYLKLPQVSAPPFLSIQLLISLFIFSR